MPLKFPDTVLSLIVFPSDDEYTKIPQPLGDDNIVLLVIVLPLDPLRSTL